MSPNDEPPTPELSAADRYAKALEGLRTAVHERDFERLGDALKEYYSADLPMASMADRMRLLGAALVESMGLLN